MRRSRRRTARARRRCRRRSSKPGCIRPVDKPRRAGLPDALSNREGRGMPCLSLFCLNRNNYSPRRMSGFPHSRAMLPLIPPTPFSHKGRRGSLGVLMAETGDSTQGIARKHTPVRMTLPCRRVPHGRPLTSTAICRGAPHGRPLISAPLVGAIGGDGHHILSETADEDRQRKNVPRSRIT
jgi:hypothetical protein